MKRNKGTRAAPERTPVEAATANVGTTSVMTLLSVGYLLGIAYFVWAIATNNMAKMSRPGFTVGFGIFVAVGLGLIVTKPLIPKLLAVTMGVLMSVHAYLVLRQQRALRARPDKRRPRPTGRRKSPPSPIRPAGRGLIGDGEMDQAFGFASPGGIMALATVRGLKTKGWTRVASWVLVGAFLCGALAILLSTLFG